MAFFLFLDCVYGLIFVAIAQLGWPFGWRFVIGYNAALGLLLVIQSLLFFTIKVGSTGWVSYSIQKVVHSDSSVYGTYGLFLLGAAVWALVRRERSPM